MALGVIATLTIQEGKNEEFEAVFSELAEQVIANEPDTLFYSLHHSREEPQVYKVLEQYANNEALSAHGITEYFQAASKKLGTCLAAAPELEILDTV